MSTRRTFLKNTGISMTGMSLVPDTYWKTLASFTGRSEKELSDAMKLSCYLSRPDDFLFLKLHFINLHRDWLFGHLTRTNKDDDAYIIVQLRQQHVAEELKGYILGAGCSIPVQSTDFARSLLSGFSYITLKLPDKHECIPFNEKHLLDWSQFEVIGKEGLGNGAVLPVDMKDNYPLSENNYPFSKNKFPATFLFASKAGLEIPITLIEAPYKMFVTPCYPEDEDGQPPIANSAFRHFFLKNNRQRLYFQTEHSRLVLSEYWNNDLVTSPAVGSAQPIHIKVVGYEETDSTVTPPLLLLPNPQTNDRYKLAQLTNLKDGHRDVTTDYFRISTMGLSTYYRYFNLKDNITAGLDIVGWKQEIQLGRDNYVEIIRKGIDLRSGLRVLMIRIAERRIENGISFLLYRLRFEYLDKEKNYPANNVKYNNGLFKRIVPKAKGSYYAQLNWVADHPAGIDAGKTLSKDDACIAGTECGPVYPDRMLKMPYTGYDALGNPHDFQMDVCLVSEDYFTRHQDLVNITINTLNAQMADSSFSHFHAISFDKEIIGYARSDQNTQFATDEIQFYPIITDTYDADVSLLPCLKYAMVYLPQLQGLEPVATARPVSYSGAYITSGFGAVLKVTTAKAAGGKAKASIASSNWAQVFLQILDPAVKNTAVTSDAAAALATLKGVPGPITNIFTDNYRNAGQLINPDIVINELSTAAQSLTMLSQMNSLPNTGSLNPSLLLRGVHVEVFGGLNLLKILQQAIPLQESPLFQVVDQAASSVIPVAADAQNTIQRLQTNLQTLSGELNTAQTKLTTLIDLPINTYISKYKKIVSLTSRTTNWKQLLGSDGKYLYQTLYHYKKGAASQFIARLAIDGTRNTLTYYAMAQTCLPITSFFDDVDIYAALQKLLAYKQILDQVSTILATIDLNTYAQQAGDYTALLATLKIAFSDTQALYATLNNGLKLMQPALQLRDSTKPALALAAKGKIMAFEGSVLVLDDAILNLPIYSNSAGVKTVATILQDSHILTGSNYLLTDDVGGWNDYLQNEADSIKQYFEDGFSFLTDIYTDIYQYTTSYITDTVNHCQSEIAILQGQINNEVSAALAEKKNQLWNLLQQTEPYNNIKDSYTQFQKTYLTFKQFRSDLDQLQIGADKIEWPDWKDDDHNTASQPVDGTLIQFLGNLKTLYSKQLSNFGNQLNKEGQDALKILSADLSGMTDTDLVDAVGYTQKFEIDFATQLNQAVAQLTNLVGQAQQAVQDQLTTIKNTILDDKKKLLDLLQQYGTRTIQYNWNTEAFDDSDLGILQFTTDKQNKTRLEVDISSTISFDFKTLPPKISNTVFKTSSSVTNFSITFLRILTIDFDKVGLNTQTGQSDQFDVQVRNVHFDGALNFVQVFQQYLLTLDKNLRVDITADGVTLDYALTLPDITGGVFNFIGASLSINFLLPFKAGVPMQLNFGFGTPQSLVLVSGSIFGGEFCLILGTESKRGIVAITMIFEVGAVLYLDLGVASGKVYLYAGFYFQKDYDKVLIKGYLTCGGYLKILGLITLSVTFNMGLQGSGKYLDGYCTLSISIDIGPFFSISVDLSMYKRIYGCPDNNATPGTAVLPPDNTMALLAMNGGPAGTSTDGDIKPNFIDVVRQRNQWEDYFKAYYHRTQSKQL